MKTRIISGIVMGAIVATILAVGFLWAPIVITLAVAALAVGAVYELLHNAAGIKSKAAIIGACVYGVITILFNDPTIIGLLSSLGGVGIIEILAYLKLAVSVLYFIYAAIIVLKNHKDFGLAQIAVLCAMPQLLVGLFTYLDLVIISNNGLFYLLLLFNFSSVCDMGAYFVGVTMGKHKLCPNLSPKKTVEGAIGGIVSSIIVTIILCLCFSKSLLLPIILTIPFCIVGMVGDLFASSIKRAVGLKDYGNLIPGHGGILDRVDSIIMIAPLLYLCTILGVI